MKIQKVEYKEVVVPYDSEHNLRLVNDIWSRAPFKFHQYTDVRKGNLVEVFVMPSSVWDEHIEKIVEECLQALLEAAE